MLSRDEEAVAVARKRVISINAKLITGPALFPHITSPELLSTTAAKKKTKNQRIRKIGNYIATVSQESMAICSGNHTTIGIGRCHGLPGILVLLSCFGTKAYQTMSSGVDDNHVRGRRATRKVSRFDVVSRTGCGDIDVPFDGLDIVDNAHLLTVLGRKAR